MIAVCQKMTAASSSTPIAMISSPVAGRSPETPPPPCAPSLAISAEPELFENTFDAGRLGVEERLILITSQRDHGPVTRLAGLRPLRRGSHLLDQRNHRLPRSRIDAGRRKHTAPVEQLDIDALFLQRRRVDALLALVGRNRDQPELAGLDLLGEFAVARNARRHLIAKQGSGRRPATRE